MRKRCDHFSTGVVIYAACFFLLYQSLFQWSLNHELSWLSSLSWALIILHTAGFLWCVAASLLLLMPLQLASFVCAALLVIGLQFSYPDPVLVHFWLHKSEYLARLSAAQPLQDGRIALLLYSHGTYIPSMPGGYLCATEIVYDNSENIDLIARSPDGRALVRRIDGNFYFRYPPCG